MQDINKSYGDLMNSEQYNKFKAEHPKSFLFACFLTNGQWQFDFFCDNKVIVFRDNLIEEKDQLLNSDSKVENLDIKKIKIKPEEAIETARNVLKTHHDETDKRIVLLQKINKEIVWNITLLTKNMNIMNVKINAITGKIINESFQSIFKLKK